MSENKKKPANIRISPNARRRGNDSLFSLYYPAEVQARQPIPLFSFPHIEAATSSDTVTMV